jgi:hypothetical protein
VPPTLFEGINGTNPLGFMASVGLLRVLTSKLICAQCNGPAGSGARTPRLGFTNDGAFHAWIECDSEIEDIPGIIAKDAEDAAGPQPWRLQYEKQEKRGIKIVNDLKAPPERFSRYLDSAIDSWLAGQPEQSNYAVAYGTDVALDGKGNTKPTAFHFTAANQEFLGTVEETRSKVTREWAVSALEDSSGKVKPGRNLRWDPDAERSRALMGVNPNDDGTTVNAPLEWLAFRGLPAFPCVPIGNRIVTSGVTRSSQDGLCFHWPLWSCGASYATLRSLLGLTAGWIEIEHRARRLSDTQDGRARPQRSSHRLQRSLEAAVNARRTRSVFALCTSEIRRTPQGFGNFGPAHIQN